MSSGLAKGASWSLNMLSPDVRFRLTELERAAKAAHKGQWLNYVSNPSNVQNQAKFRGTVVEIISGDCLTVKADDSGVERRVTLSSIRAPRPPARDRAGEPYGAEAKEFLRGRLIGKTVDVEMEYSKKIPVGVNAKEERTVDFGQLRRLHLHHPGHPVFRRGQPPQPVRTGGELVVAPAQLRPPDDNALETDEPVRVDEKGDAKKPAHEAKTGEAKSGEAKKKPAQATKPTEKREPLDLR